MFLMRAIVPGGHTYSQPKNPSHLVLDSPGHCHQTWPVRWCIKAVMKAKIKIAPFLLSHGMVISSKKLMRRFEIARRHVRNCKLQGSAFQGNAHVQHLNVIGDGEHSDGCARVRGDCHQAFGLKSHQSLSHRDLADTHRLGDLVLANRSALCERPVDDTAPDFCIGFLNSSNRRFGRSHIERHLFA